MSDQNLQRLATKVASGGEDTGYAKGPKGKKQAPPPKKNFAKQVAMSFFKKEI